MNWQNWRSKRLIKPLRVKSEWMNSIGEIRLIGGIGGIKKLGTGFDYQSKIE